ncbi:hypothetical protein StoSoilB20_17670 [Arthrobacter sp. StoSoilB20]|nr:hypothetical protein StoSoilB20_17670 [Arthrobacter sp. StoSoilB20]
MPGLSGSGNLAALAALTGLAGLGLRLDRVWTAFGLRLDWVWTAFGKDRPHRLDDYSASVASYTMAA